MSWSGVMRTAPMRSAVAMIMRSAGSDEGWAGSWFAENQDDEQAHALDQRRGGSNGRIALLGLGWGEACHRHCIADDLGDQRHRPWPVGERWFDQETRGEQRGRGEVGSKGVGELGDDGDEDQVEEELQEGDASPGSRSSNRPGGRQSLLSSMLKLTTGEDNASAPVSRRVRGRVNR